MNAGHPSSTPPRLEPKFSHRTLPQFQHSPSTLRLYSPKSLCNKANSTIPILCLPLVRNHAVRPGQPQSLDERIERDHENPPVIRTIYTPVRAINSEQLTNEEAMDNESNVGSNSTFDDDTLSVSTAMTQQTTETDLLFGVPPQPLASQWHLPLVRF